MNIYTYDTKGQLLSNIWGAADYGTRVFTGTTNVNQEKGISYDTHGNLLKLQRSNGAGTTVNNFTYRYQAGTNKLSSVTGYANYTYDALGQLASQVKGTAGMYLEYDVSGKVTGIYNDAAKSVIMLSFVYDESGKRVMKKDHRTNSVTWYSYDVAGTLLGVFESKSGGALQLLEQQVYGSERLGMLNRLGGNYSYALTDHLGNTRAIINRNKLSGGFADVQYSADYYPYGLEARSAGIDTRYGYQGLYPEKDKETSWNNFEARNYDASIGRWLTTDPKEQYASPYVGMGNNPIIYIDRNGEWAQVAAAVIGAVVGGGVAAYDLHTKGQLEWSWRAAGKIGIGAGTGALTALLPVAAIGASGTLLATSLAVGGIAAGGDVLDQMWDIHKGYSKSFSYSHVGVEFAKAAGTFGVFNKGFSLLRYNSIKSFGTTASNTALKYIYKYPGVASQLYGASTGIGFSAMKKNWFKFDFSSFNSSINSSFNKLFNSNKDDYIFIDLGDFKTWTKPGTTVKLPEVSVSSPSKNK